MLERKSFLTLTGVIFLVIAVLHLVRAVIGLPAVIAGFVIPVWLSWVAIVVAAFLSYNAFALGRKK